MRTFLDRYYLHLLSVPRENVAIGDLYPHDGKRVSTPGKVMDFLTPPLEMPPLNIGEHMADVSGTMSNGISVQQGLGFLEGFLTALGALGILNKVRANYESKKASSMKFRFAHATRDSVNAFELGSKLIRHKVMEDHPLYEKGYRYYLVTAVARTPSISIMAENDEDKAVTIDVGAMELGEVTTGITVEKSSETEVTFIGKKSLAFGVELYELTYDPKRSKLKLKIPEGLIKVRGSSEIPVKPAFIGGPNDDIFLDVE
jgi:hypothetical protein